MSVTSLRLAPDAAQEAFCVVVTEHQAAVHAYLRRRVADASRAEDLTQEVFLRAWRGVGGFDAGRTDVRGWLLTIARNLTIDTYRADAVRPQTIGSDALLAAVPVADEIDEAVGAWVMSDALRRLAPAHRDVLLCLYYRRWSIVQTAAHLQVAAGTVKSRSTYALRALRLILDEMEACP